MAPLVVTNLLLNSDEMAESGTKLGSIIASSGRPRDTQLKRIIPSSTALRS